MEGLVSNIQRFSIDDGPGIRTTVFLKGCNLHCLWCHNPESIDPGCQIQFFSQKCIKCLNCCRVCMFGARSAKGDDIVFTGELCRQCGKCVKACYSGALALSGKIMTEIEVMNEVIKDRPFYETSCGGVTFSGGEPLLQKDFLRELLVESKKQGLNTVVDTAGNVPWESFYEILNHTDMFLFDIKMMDNEMHKLSTGVENYRILDNLKRLTENKAVIRIRIPIIPGINDNIREAEKIAGFLQRLDGVEHIDLLPYHDMGKSKYSSLGMEYKYKGFKPPDEDLMNELFGIFIKRGFKARM